MRALTDRFRDPHRVNLRKASRAALVVPSVFALLVVIGNTPSALFAAFGSFAALVFSDLGGPRFRRFRAYLLLAVVGAVLVALGTACADTTWLAVVATGTVAFTISMCGALGGYFAAAGTSATLAFVLPVMSPIVEADLASRELGWVVGVTVAGVAAIVLWPVHQRDRVRAAAAAVFREAATALVAPAAERDLTALRAADAELTARTGVVYRPAGSITAERALVALAIAARRLSPLVERVTAADRSVTADPTPEYAALARCVAGALTDSARVVAREIDQGQGRGAIEHARAAHADALERWAVATLPAAGATRVVDGFTGAFPLRRLSLAAVQIADAADTAVHDTVRTRAAGETAMTTAWVMLRGHCHVRSVRFRNAARAGLGLAVAVLVAKTASVEHAFWVVLAALSVLRSNALGTGATAVQALAGALIGFASAAALMATIGGDTTGLWLALPIVVFLAAYTPGAVNFVVGQAGFTVFVVVLFNILVPDGWRTGLVRVQDIAIGAGVSVAVGALLWPRGARGVARRSFADLLRAASGHLSVALDVAVRRVPGDLSGAAAEAADARARAVAALEDLVLERGGGHVDRTGWGTLLVEALQLELAADGVGRAVPASAANGCRDAAGALAREGDAVIAAVRLEADQVVADGIRSLEPGPRPPSLLPEALTACLASRSPSQLPGVLGLVWVHEWLVLAADHPR